MKAAKTDLKVGLFVLISLVLLGVLMLSFSKARSLFTPVFNLTMKTSNVAGIKSGAGIALLGVYIGNVGEAVLDPDGKSVSVPLIIHNKYRGVLRKDAQFTIEQAGFLGDQYIAIVPGTESAEPLEDGAFVTAAEPFNILEMARSAGGLLEKVDEALKGLTNIINRLDTMVMTEQTLTNVSAAVVNFRKASDDALAGVGTIKGLIARSEPTIGETLTNFSAISIKLDTIAAKVDAVVEENRAPLNRSVTNLEKTTANAQAVTAELQEGKGLVGDLLKNKELQEELKGLIANLSVASSNLANYGVFYNPSKKRKKTSTSTTRSIYTGKNAPK